MHDLLCHTSRVHAPSRLIAVALLMLFAGCASRPPYEAPYLPAVARAVVGLRPPVDKRAEFRAEFCGVLQRSGLPPGRKRCGDYLWHLPDEKRLRHSLDTSHPAPLHATLLIVGGAFGDCVPPASTPFAGSVAQLKSSGLDIAYIPVEGRSSSRTNAGIIEHSITTLDPQDRGPVILLGYSKGTADIIEALTRYPAIVNRISAVVSVAGAVNGSPLAARYHGLYDFWLQHRRFGSCPRGDGGVLDSLTPSWRLNWLACYPLPTRIKYYSLVTFVMPPGLSRIFRRPYRELSRIDARNDGQLLAYDQIIPGSALLGYAKADHWGVALSMEDRYPFLAHRSVGRHAFPQEVLLESIMRFVLQDLATSASDAHGQTESLNSAASFHAPRGPGSATHHGVWHPGLCPVW